MKKIDLYILKRYLSTFFVMILLFIPIGIIVDVSEKINKMLENKAPFSEIIGYYLDFTVYYANMLFPIFLFLSIIWFTSKLANNTEIVAILSSGIAYTRFLRPYFIGATFISLFALLLGLVLVPKASKGFNDFKYTYLKNNGTAEMRESENVYRQISKNEFIYVNNFNYVSKTGFEFTLEKFKNNKLVTKITASRIQYDEKKKNYTLYDYSKRSIGENNDVLEFLPQKTMQLNFDVDDLTPVVYIAETMTLGALNKFIDKEKLRGSANINTYLVVKYKKYTTAVSAFILTVIAVAVSSKKRRGGMGISLALGIAIAFSFVFLDKIFGVMAEKSSLSPLILVWMPNILFSVLALYLLNNAKR